MFPIAKNNSTYYMTDKEYNPATTPTYIKTSGIKETKIFNNGSVSATFGISKYPDYPTGNELLISDNGGTNYNKMYYIIGESGSFSANDIWESETYYDFDFYGI
jgi:hypothetical protein